VSNISTIKTKLAALLARARDAGSSDAEIAACMSKADKIMAEYNLSESDLDSVGADSFSEYGFTVPTSQTRLCPVVRMCAAQVAKYTGVQVWTSGTNSHGNAAALKVFGLDADVEYATWLLTSWRTFMDDQWKDYRDNLLATSRKVMTQERVGFVRGFCAAINKRLADHIRDAELNTGGGVKTGYALVVKKNDIVARRMEERGISLSSNTSSINGQGRGTDSGQNAGVQAGNAAHVGQGLGRNATAIGKY
tara:strand:- start:5 stop:754 length:750 start_codon:yes stop_codon:yes gene_type:complete